VSYWVVGTFHRVWRNGEGAQGGQRVEVLSSRVIPDSPLVATVAPKSDPVRDAVAAL
jgi:hypothetical protein